MGLKERSFRVYYALKAEVKDYQVFTTKGKARWVRRRMVIDKTRLLKTMSEDEINRRQQIVHSHINSFYTSGKLAIGKINDELAENNLPRLLPSEQLAHELYFDVKNQIIVNSRLSY